MRSAHQLVSFVGSLRLTPTPFGCQRSQASGLTFQRGSSTLRCDGKPWSCHLSRFAIRRGRVVGVSFKPQRTGCPLRCLRVGRRTPREGGPVCGSKGRPRIGYRPRAEAANLHSPDTEPPPEKGGHATATVARAHSACWQDPPLRCSPPHRLRRACRDARSGSSSLRPRLRSSLRRGSERRCR